jgi:hypothetical protein
VKPSFVLAESVMFACAAPRQAGHPAEDRNKLTSPHFKIHHGRAAKIRLQQ